MGAMASHTPFFFTFDLTGTNPMSTNHPVVVYGASGYTGKLVAWKLAKRGIPFIAAGRDKGRLEAEMAKVPELKGHDYRCVAVQHDKAALTDLFTGRQVSSASRW